MNNHPEISAALSAIQATISTMAKRDEEYHKERANHVSDMKVMSNSIRSLTASSDRLNNSVNELIMSSKLAEHQISGIEATAELRHRDLTQKIMSVEGRVSTLEHHRSEAIGERKIVDRSRTFWQNNWYKFVTLFLAAIPVIYVIYGLVKIKSGGG